jgi:phage replication initiation protein
MFIDWLSITVPGDTPSVLDRLHSYFGDWEVLDYGGSGYDCSAKLAETGRVFWNRERKDMGVHLKLPASALKALPRDAVTILCALVAMGGKASRLDITADDFDGLLDMDLMRDKVLRGEFLCRAHNGREERSLFGEDGHTLYFGSRRSDTLLRIYDKKAEQASQKIDVTFCDTWVRVETELKNDRADGAAQYIAQHPETWFIEAAGWLLDFLDFKDPGTDSNISRWETSDWWSAFVERAKKAKIVVMQEERTVEDVKAWVEKQVAPSLFVLEATVGHEDLFQMVAEGSGRLKDRHKKMIDDYQKMLEQMSR